MCPEGQSLVIAPAVQLGVATLLSAVPIFPNYAGAPSIMLLAKT